MCHRPPPTQSPPHHQISPKLSQRRFPVTAKFLPPSESPQITKTHQNQARGVPGVGFRSVITQQLPGRVVTTNYRSPREHSQKHTDTSGQMSSAHSKHIQALVHVHKHTHTLAYINRPRRRHWYTCTHTLNESR